MSESAFRRVVCSLTLLLVASFGGNVGLATAADSGQVLFEGEFVPTDLVWQVDEDGLRYPGLKNTRELEEPGQPRLPARELLLLVPVGTDVARAWIEPLATHREDLDGPLAAGAPLEVDGGEPVTQGVLAVGDAAFPAQWGRFTGTHVWRGYRLLSLTVYPVRRLDAGDGAYLEFLDAYAVRAEFKPVTDADVVARRERLVPGESANNAQVLFGLVDNPNAVSGYTREHGAVVAEATNGFQPSKTPSLTGSAVSYLIITNEAMAPAFQVMADFKTAQGIPTVVATTEYILANYRQGADVQETIRMFIRDAYTKWGIEYVLLGGDSDVLPPRYVKNSFYPTTGYTSIPVDLYFACLDGNWNANGDSEYGQPQNLAEPSDEADFAEEVYIGRAPVSSPEAATVFVNKVMTYETTSSSWNWPNRSLFAAEVLFPSDYHVQQYIILDGAKFADQQVNTHIEPCTNMEYLRMYETDDENPWDVPLTREALIDTLNNGRYGIVNQIGHGYYFNMSVADANFMTTDADALTNGDHLFLIYALNCASAAFDNSCLLERFIQNPNGGAVAAIGSVRAAFPNNSNNYQQEFFRLLYCAPDRRAGQLVALSRLPYIGLTNDNYVDRWTFENYTLLGDPTLALWTGSPSELAVSSSTSVGLGPSNLPVTVTAGGMPVENAVVCFGKGDEDYVFGVTDAAGQVNLGIQPVTMGNAVVTVTGKNLEQFAYNVTVGGGSAYLAVETMPLIDDGTGGSSGDSDGIVDAGEIVALSPVMRETGGSGATLLSGTLSTGDAGVTIINGSTTYPDVAAGGAAAAQTPYLVQFDSDLVDGTAITFELAVSSGGETYYSDWTVVVKAPEIEVTELDWEDTTHGNDDGVIDASERLVVEVDLKNFGAADSGPLSAVMRTDSAAMTLYDSTSTWSSLNLLDEGKGLAAFSLSWNDLLADGTARIVVTDDMGRTLRHDFTLPRPVAPLNITTDTSLGPDVIALSWDPSGSADVFGYNVYRSGTEGGTYLRVNADVVAGTSYFRDTGLAELSQYFYKVAAVDSSRVPSVMSASVSQSTAPAEAVGFPAAFANETSSPLAVGDIDGDGDREVVLASENVYVWHHDGLELLDGDNDSQTLGVFTDFPVGSVVGPAGVTLAPLDGVAGLEMIISEQVPSVQIHIYRKDGTELPGWPRSTNGLTGPDWNWSAPSVGDIDGDGEAEIVVNTLNGVVWAWNVDGSEVRDGDANPATTGVFFDRDGADYEWSRSGPSLYDLDGDGAKDIIFGTKFDASGTKRLMALRYDGAFVSGFPYVAFAPIDCEIAIGDLDGDTQVELVFYDKSRRVYAVRQDGTDYPGFPVQMPYTADNQWVTSPGLGDMDGDGQLEIIYAPNQDGLHCNVVVVDTDYTGGTSGQVLAGWPVELPGSSEGSPVVGDIDGDGSLEVLHGIGGGDESAPYNLYALHSDGTSVAGFPITLSGPVMNSALITDIDSDLDVDIVYGGWDFQVHVWDMPFAYDRYNTPWPMFKGNISRDGVLFPLDLLGVDDGPTVPAAPMFVQRPYPNPFNPSATIRLYLADAGELELEVFDVQGRRVRRLHTGLISAGWHDLVWDGRDDGGRGQSSGMYFVRARGAGMQQVEKMTLVK